VDIFIGCNLRIIFIIRILLFYHFQQYFSFNAAVSFIGGGNEKTNECHKSLTNFIT